MTPRSFDFEANLRHRHRLTHDEELDLMEQGISLDEHYGLAPNQYILPPYSFIACRWVEKYDLTVMYGAHSLDSAEHALLTQRLTGGALLPQAVATGVYHELHKTRADSVVTATPAPDIKPRFEVLPEPIPPNVKLSIEEADSEFQDRNPLKQEVKRKINLVDLDYDSEDEAPLQKRVKRKPTEDEDFEDEISVKRRRKNTQLPAPAPTAPKIKLKFKAPPPPARPKAAPPATSTPRKRTSIKSQPKDEDSDDDYQPPTRSINSTPRPSIYTNTSLPYTTNSTAPTSQPTRTPSITSSGRSISPPPTPQVPDVAFKRGTRKIPANIKEIVDAVRKVKKGKEDLPQRIGLRNTVGFTGRDGVLKTSSVLREWYGDTRLFSEREWKYLVSNEEGKRKRNGGLR